MHRDQQRVVVVAQPDEAGANERSAAEVERRIRFGGDGVVEVVDNLRGQIEAERIEDTLQRLAADLDERGA